VTIGLPALSKDIASASTDLPQIKLAGASHPAATAHGRRPLKKARPDFPSQSEILFTLRNSPKIGPLFCAVAGFSRNLVNTTQTEGVNRWNNPPMMMEWYLHKADQSSRLAKKAANSGKRSEFETEARLWLGMAAEAVVADRKAIAQLRCAPPSPARASKR
jgi:hypothetical protein